MTAVELTRVVAHHQGWRQDGGWIFADTLPLAQGYDALAANLQRLGIIKVGAGIDWMTLTRTRTRRIKRGI